MDMSMIDAASGGALVDKTPKAARNLIANMAANSQQFNIRNDLLPPPKRVNETTQTQLQHLENQIGQLATSMSRIEGRTSGKLPSQPKINPKENASSMSLRSGKQLEPLLTKSSKVSTTSSPFVTNSSSEALPLTRKDDSYSALPVDPSGQVSTPSPRINSLFIPPPFPSRFKQSKKKEQEKEIHETFRKVEVNIPLFDAIKQVPRYAKFLKELCSNKRKLSGNEKVSVGENVSTVIQRKLPPKCKDPDPMEETGIIIQLLNRSNAYPRGVMEDVLVQVNELVFPVDFYIIEMEDELSPNPTPILLGRPFLKTARTKIDVHD
ncbi:uncharacterized protein LOC107176621 [Citrus sinensis]|uniref:uncharacterized protein LOC107176621 n=1 Tax=Citrus sinensis TaxID=2711 RepID=UPI002277D16F|nr:uncharacterized protein LOC107176621 [Citrus sinensis]